jgi:hypothetical protein
MNIIQCNQIPGWSALLALFLNLTLAAFLLLASLTAHGYDAAGQLAQPDGSTQSCMPLARLDALDVLSVSASIPHARPGQILCFPQNGVAAVCAGYHHL